MTPEEGERQKIDRLLEAGGLQVQDYKKLNLSAASGVAVRESRRCPFWPRPAWTFFWLKNESLETTPGEFRVIYEELGKKQVEVGI